MQKSLQNQKIEQNFIAEIYIFFSIRIRMKQKEIVEKRIIMLVDLKCFFSDI